MFQVIRPKINIMNPFIEYHRNVINIEISTTKISIE